MSFLIRPAADQSVPDRLIPAPRSINFCPPEVYPKQDARKTVCLTQGTDKGDNIKLWMPPNSRCKRCDIQDKGKSQHQWASNEFFWSQDWHTQICICINIYIYDIQHIIIYLIDIQTTTAIMFSKKNM